MATRKQAGKAGAMKRKGLGPKVARRIAGIKGAKKPRKK